MTDKTVLASIFRARVKAATDQELIEVPYGLSATTARQILDEERKLRQQRKDLDTLNTLAELSGSMRRYTEHDFKTFSETPEEKEERLLVMAGVKQPDINAEGRKDDTGKLPYDLIAPEFLAGTAEILAFGAAKYAPRNWEKGMAWSRPFSALMRHMWAWWAGEKLDPETGKSHLWHACCCLMFLVAYEQRSTGTDDRPNFA